MCCQLFPSFQHWSASQQKKMGDTQGREQLLSNKTDYGLTQELLNTKVTVQNHTDKNVESTADSKLMNHPTPQHVCRKSMMSGVSILQRSHDKLGKEKHTKFCLFLYFLWNSNERPHCTFFSFSFEMILYRMTSPPRPCWQERSMLQQRVNNIKNYSPPRINLFWLNNKSTCRPCQNPFSFSEAENLRNFPLLKNYPPKWTTKHI